MNRRPLIALVAAVPLALVACAPPLGAGAATTENREISDVTAVSVDGVGRLTISPGAEPSLSVEAGDRIMRRITTEVRDGVLVLDVDGPMWGSTGEVRYDLVLPAVEHITVAGVADVDADLSTATDLEIELEGAGQVTGRELDVHDLRVDIDGAGEVVLDGSATQQTVGIAGVGRYDGERLTTRLAEVAIGGAGQAEVRATEVLDARVEGAGEVRHSGGAQVTQHIEGIGRVHAH
ncbi:DUF2807 domain-containing protein [Georgenia sp. 10Sc9-8]|uniref:DUF2807 domain-containing protein n=1 Tax=Georgenia halotolerans TaxID=3028317 RepID=A0ABT5U1E2_9MICO|nr:DUF2807 domain-containing protein [Georgenia halotolerans]